MRTKSRELALLHCSGQNKNADQEDELEVSEPFHERQIVLGRKHKTRAKIETAKGKRVELIQAIMPSIERKVKDKNAAACQQGQLFCRQP